MQSSQAQCLAYDKSSIVADSILTKTGNSSAGHTLHEMHNIWKLHYTLSEWSIKHL